MSSSGFASRSTRSASLPFSTVPRRLSMPRNFAGLHVAVLRASPGVNPACTNNSSLIVQAEPAKDVRSDQIGSCQEIHSPSMQRAYQLDLPAIEPHDSFPIGKGKVLHENVVFGCPIRYPLLGDVLQTQVLRHRAGI